MAQTTFTILGCGSSGGVPRLGGHWGDCDPNNPRNRRRRCSLLVERIGENGTTTVLIDTSPDLRDQLLGTGTGRLDAVIYTHAFPLRKKPTMDETGLGQETLPWVLGVEPHLDRVSCKHHIILSQRQRLAFRYTNL